MSGTKELSFFLPPETQRITTLDEYSRCFEEAADHPIRGEASVNYFYHDDSPRLMRETLGSQLKIIIMLRNPVDMAYSLWGHNRRLARERYPFKEALAREDARVSGEDELIGWRPNYFYRRRAIYTPQLKRYLDVFPREQVKVILLEDMVQDPVNQLTELCHWLDITVADSLVFPRLNPAGMTRSKGLRTWLDGGSMTKRFLKFMLPDAVRLPVRRSLDRMNRVNRPMDRLDDSSRRELKQIFQEDVASLSGMLNRDLTRRWLTDAEVKKSP